MSGETITTRSACALPSLRGFCMGIIGNNMETTTMGYIGLMVMGYILGYSWIVV